MRLADTGMYVLHYSSFYGEKISDYSPQSKILVPARLTCALVLSDTDVGSGVNGAHLAYWCGQFLMGRTEQYELLKWLEIFMKKTKWPNRTCIDRLHKQWVLVPDDSFDRDLPPPV